MRFLDCRQPTQGDSLVSFFQQLDTLINWRCRRSAFLDFMENAFGFTGIVAGHEHGVVQFNPAEAGVLHQFPIRLQPDRRVVT